MRSSLYLPRQIGQIVGEHFVKQLWGSYDEKWEEFGDLENGFTQSRIYAHRLRRRGFCWGRTILGRYRSSSHDAEQAFLKRKSVESIQAQKEAMQGVSKSIVPPHSFCGSCDNPARGSATGRTRRER